MAKRKMPRQNDEASMQEPGQREPRNMAAPLESEWLSATLSSIGDAVISTDVEGRVTFMNPVAERLTGWSSAEGIGQPLTTVFRLVDEATRQPCASPVERALRQRDVVGLETRALIIAKDGRTLAIDDSAAPIHTADGRMAGAVLVFRDIAQQRQAERRRAARIAATQALSQETNVDQAIAQVLAAVCSALGWDVGGFWRVQADEQVLRCEQFWESSKRDCEAFRDATMSIAFAPGDSLPGKVWQDMLPVWIPDIVGQPTFRRSAVAQQVGVHGGFACPVSSGAEFLGVIECFSQEIQQPDDDLLEMMATVGSQIGQYIARRETERQLKRHESDLADFFEHAAFGLHWVGPDGIILRANQAELDMLGYTQEEYVGHPIADFHVDREVIEDILARLSKGDTIHDHPARMRCKDGSIRDVRINSNVLFEDGKFTHSRCLTRDVTEEKKAQETRGLLAAIVAASDDAIVSKTLNGIILSWNAGAERVFGYTAAEMVGQPIYTIIPPDKYQEETAILERLRRGERIDHFETVRVAKDGRRLDISLTVSPLRDEEGRVIGASKTARDITDRKRAEATLRKHSTETQTLLETLPIGVFFARDPKCRRVTANRTGYELLRWPVDENISLTNENAKATFRVCRNGIEVAPDQMPLPRAARGETIHNDEIEIMFHDGTVLHLLISAAPLYDGGTVRGAVASALDVTDRKRMEQSLRFLSEVSKLLASLVDYKRALQQVAQLAVRDLADWCLVDVLQPDGSLQRVAVAHNDPATLRMAEEMHRLYPLDPAISRGITTVLHSGKPELIAEINDDILATAARDERHLRFLQGLNLRSCMFVPISAKGNILGTLTLVSAESGRRYGTEDVALVDELAHRAAVAIENAQLYESIRDGDRRKDEFLAMLAHELRNPLAPIRSGLDILALDGDENEETIVVMQDHIQHLVRLVDDLLDVSRIMRGRIELRKEPVELSALVQRSIEAVRSMIETHHQELVVDLPEQPIWLSADPVRLLQVVENLLNNASKYTDPGGRIEVKVECHADDVSISIRDTGMGIEPNLLPQVFELFTQSSRSLDRAQGGLGIGLTLVKRLVEFHQGTVTAHSEGAGQGSTFVVRLPLSQPVETIQKNQPTVAMPAGRRILVVDDNLGAAQMLSLLLTKLGNHQVESAYDGESALEKAALLRPEIVLLDIGLPGMNGYEVARAMRRMRELDGVILAALTGYGQEEDRQKSKEAGFDAHLVKPVELADLKALLAQRA